MTEFTFKQARQWLRALVVLAFQNAFQFVIISGNANGEDRTEELAATLRAIDLVVLPGIGYWKGEQEQSLMVFSDHGHFHDGDLYALMDAAKLYKQTSIIVAKGTNAALLNMDNRFSAFSAAEAFFQPFAVASHPALTRFGDIVEGDEAKTGDSYSEFADIAFRWEEITDVEAIHNTIENAITA